MERNISAWLTRKGEQALRKLWKMANSEETPEPRRVTLLQWFAEMGIGKAKVMELQPTKATGGGVVILPSVMTPIDPTNDQEIIEAGYTPLNLI